MAERRRGDGYHIEPFDSANKIVDQIKLNL